MSKRNRSARSKKTDAPAQAPKTVSGAPDAAVTDAATLPPTPLQCLTAALQWPYSAFHLEIRERFFKNQTQLDKI